MSKELSVEVEGDDVGFFYGKIVDTKRLILFAKGHNEIGGT